MRDTTIAKAPIAPLLTAARHPIGIDRKIYVKNAGTTILTEIPTRCLTMSVAGLWHGAKFNFILWGFLNGLFLCLEKSFTAFTKSKSILRITISFSFYLYL